MSTYQVREDKTGTLLADGLNDEQLATWWRQNEARYFGVRVTGNVINVAPAEGWAP